MADDTQRNLEIKVTEDATQAISANETLVESQAAYVAGLTEIADAEREEVIAREEATAAAERGAIAQESWTAAMEKAASAQSDLAATMTGQATSIEEASAATQELADSVLNLSVDAQTEAESLAQASEATQALATATLEQAAAQAALLDNFAALSAAKTEDAAASTADAAANTALAGAEGAATAEGVPLNDVTRSIAGGHTMMARAALDAAIRTLGLGDAIRSAAPAIIGLAVAGVAYNAVLGQMKDRELDASTFGDLLEGVMDKLAVSMGGTTKATADLVTEIDKKKQAMVSDGEAVVVFASASDRLRAAGVDAGKVMAELTADIQQNAQEALAAGGASHAMANEMNPGLSNAAAVARGEISQLNTAMNILGSVNPEKFTDLNRQFLDLSRSMNLTDAAIKALIDGAQQLIGMTPQLAKQLEDMGKTGQEAFATLVTSGQQLDTEYEGLIASGKSLEEVRAIEYDRLSKMIGVLNTLAPAYHNMSIEQKKLYDDLKAATTGVLDPAIQREHQRQLAVEGVSLALRNQVVALEENLTKIQQRTDVQTAANLKELRDTKITLGEEEDEIRKAHDQGLIDDQQYYDALNKNADAYHDANTKFSKEYLETVAQQQSATKDAEEKSGQEIGATVEKLKDIGLTAGEALAIANKAYAAHAKDAEQLVDAAVQVSEKATPLVEGFGGKFESVHKIIEDLTTTALPSIVPATTAMVSACNEQIDILFGGLSSIVGKVGEIESGFSRLANQDIGLGAAGASRSPSQGAGPTEAAAGIPVTTNLPIGNTPLAPEDLVAP